MSELVIDPYAHQYVRVDYYAYGFVEHQESITGNWLSTIALRVWCRLSRGPRSRAPFKEPREPVYSTFRTTVTPAWPRHVVPTPWRTSHATLRDAASLHAARRGENQGKPGAARRRQESRRSRGRKDTRLVPTMGKYRVCRSWSLLLTRRRHDSCCRRGRWAT